MDKAFFVQAVEANSEMLFRIAWTLLHNREDCEDALQDTILKAWEKRATLREAAYFRTWITRILLNTCKDRLRRRRPAVSIDSLPEAGAEAPDPALALALQSLPEKLRLPLVLCAREGLSVREAAEILHVPESTLRRRLLRAKEALRKELSEE